MAKDIGSTISSFCEDSLQNSSKNVDTSRSGVKGTEGSISLKRALSCCSFFLALSTTSLRTVLWEGRLYLGGKGEVRSKRRRG